MEEGVTECGQSADQQSIVSRSAYHVTIFDHMTGPG